MSIWIKKLLAVVNAPTPSEGRFLAICAIVAFIGGGAKAVLKRNEQTTKKDVVCAALVSSLTGFLVGCLCLYAWGPDHFYLILPLVGVSGWVGVALMDYAGEVAMAVIKRKFDR